MSEECRLQEIYYREGDLDETTEVAELKKLRECAVVGRLFQEQEDWSKINPRHSLVIANSNELLLEAKTREIPVLAYKCPKNVDFDASKEPMIVENLSGLDYDFYQKRLERYCNQPWTICATKRCIIKELALSDVDALFALYARPHITDYLEPLFSYEEEVEYQKKYIEHIYGFYGFGMWLVWAKETGQLIGRVGVECKEYKGEPIYELGYLIDPDWQGTGVAAEVCEAVLSYMEENYEIDGVYSMIHRNNQKSMRFAEKLGFTLVEVNEEDDLYLAFYKQIKYNKI